MFYDIFIALCRDADIPPSRAASEMGFSHNALYKWKTTEGLSPRAATREKVENYFGLPSNALSSVQNETGEARNSLLYEVETLAPEQRAFALEILRHIHNGEDFVWIAGKLRSLSAPSQVSNDE